MDNAESLLCEEDAIASPWNDNVRSLCSYCADDKIDTTNGSLSTFSLDGGEGMARLLEKETSYMPDGGYLAALQAEDIGGARSIALHWILKVRNSYSFGPLTVALAVNYFDRYLSKHLSKPWKAWMVQLLSVACLSVAAKMEEVDVPLLLDLQIEGLEHIFEAKTIQRMELAVLSSLGWRMSSVTVFSYADELLHRIDINERLRESLVIRVTELLLGSLSEADFLEFRPSVITLSAVSCALEEAAPLQADTLINTLVKLLPVVKVNLDKCSRLMEELVADPVCTLISSSQVFGTPASPVTVAEDLPKENARREVARNYSNRPCSRRPTDMVPIVRCLNSRKRKLDDTLK